MSKSMGLHFNKRTIEALKGDTATNAEIKNLRKGRINEPLLYIPLDNVVPDELHLLLRITDVLTKNLINAAMTYDSKNSHTIKDVMKRPMIKSLLKAIRSCGVSFNIYINKKEGGFEFSSLVGNDKKKLLNKLPSKLSECQPKEYYKVVQQIWEV